MDTYIFFVHETTISQVEIKAKNEEEAREQWHKFAIGADDAPDLDVRELRGYGSGYELSDLHSVLDENGKEE